MIFQEGAIGGHGKVKFRSGLPEHGNQIGQISSQEWLPARQSNFLKTTIHEGVHHEGDFFVRKQLISRKEVMV